jgi:hypothetical protein
VQRKPAGAVLAHAHAVPEAGPSDDQDWPGRGRPGRSSGGRHRERGRGQAAEGEAEARQSTARGHG